MRSLSHTPALRPLSRNGVRRVSIATDVRLAMTAAMRRSMAKNKSEFDPRKFLKEATAAARDICKARFQAFGTAGEASKIKPISLGKLAERYLKDELDAVVTKVRAAA